MVHTKKDPKFTQMFSENFSPILEVFIEESMPVGNNETLLFKDRDAYLKHHLIKLEEYFKDQLINEAHAFNQGFTSINEVLPTFLSKAELEKVKMESAKAGEKILAGEVTIFCKEGDEIKNNYELLGLSEETIEHFYTVASKLFDQKKYQDAEYVLKILNFLCPFMSTFWLCLGFTEHALKKYDLACYSYRTAAFFDPENPEPLYYLASAFCDTNDFDKAKIVCDELSALSTKLKLLDEWKEKISELSNRIKR